MIQTSLEQRIIDILHEEMSVDVYWDGGSNASGHKAATTRIVNEVLLPLLSQRKGTADEIIEAMENYGLRFESPKHRQAWIDYLNEPVEDTKP